MHTETANSAALLVLHGSGRAAELIQALNRRFTAPTTQVGVFPADVLNDGSGLEEFMHTVGGDTEVSVVHVLMPLDSAEDASRSPGAPTSELSHDVVDRLATAEQTLRTRFPALSDVDSWIVIDLGRSWSKSAREVVQAILDIAEDNRIRAVFAVTGSTTRSAAGDVDDRAGMVADAAWSLAVGGLGEARGIKDGTGVWVVGSQSFTLDAPAWALIATAAEVAEAIRQGPLRPVREGMLDQAKDDAKRWVQDRGIGTEDERSELRAAANGDALERLTVSRGDVARVAAPDWAAATEREHLRLAGAPLARFTRIVRGNASALLKGRTGEATAAGHLGAFDVALAEQLRSPSGCLRTARFLNQVAADLNLAQKSVADTPLTDPSHVDIAQARFDLDTAVQRLPEVRPWLARSVFAVTASAVLLQRTPWWLATAGPLLVGALLGMWAAWKRRKAVNAREAYISAVEDHVRALGIQRMLAAQVDMIKAIQAHVGAFADAHDSPTEMEQSEPPADGTCAAETKRIWNDLQVMVDRFADPGDSLAVLSLLPRCGEFFHSYPETIDEARAIAGTRSPEAIKSRRRVGAAATEILDGLELDSTGESLIDQFTEMCVNESGGRRGVAQLQAMDPAIAEKVLAGLRRSNKPDLEPAIRPLGRHVIVAPDGELPPGFGALEDSSSSLPGGRPIFARSVDERRLSVIWLVAQEGFAVPQGSLDASRPKPAQPPEAATHEANPGVGLVERGV